MDEDKVIKKLIDHDERFGGLVSKSQFSSFREEVLSGQDEMVKILKRLDEERIFTMEWVKRIERDVEESKKRIDNQENQIAQMKVQLKLA